MKKVVFAGSVKIKRLPVYRPDLTRVVDALSSTYGRRFENRLLPLKNLLGRRVDGLNEGDTQKSLFFALFRLLRRVSLTQFSEVFGTEMVRLDDSCPLFGALGKQTQRIEQ